MRRWTPSSWLRWVRSDYVLHRMLANSGWLVGADGIGIVVGLVHGVVVTRALGADGYGVIGIVIAFVTITSRLTSFRMNEFVVKYVSDALSLHREEEAGTAIRVAALVEAGASILAFGVVWALAPLGARWFISAPDAVEWIRWYAVVVLGTVISETATGVLQVFDRFRVQSLAASAQQGISLLGVAVAVIVNAGIPGILMAHMVSTGLAAVFLSVTAWREAGRRLGAAWWSAPLRTVPGGWRRAAKFAASTNVSSTLSLIAKESDLLWLSYFRNPGEVGYYRLALSLASFVVRPLSPLVQTIYPEVARHAARKEWKDLRRLLKKTSLLTGAYVLPVTVSFAALSAVIIRFVYGEEFVPAAPAFAILLVGMGFSHIFLWARPALLALHRADYAVKISTLVVVLKLIGMIVLVPRFGYLGVAALATGSLWMGITVCVWKIESEIRRQPEVVLSAGWAAARGS